MQDKSLDAMAKKYKEEMLRLYGKKPAEPQIAAVPQPPAAEQPKDEHSETTAAEAKTVPKEEANCSKPTRKSAEELMHPPMPKIPHISQEHTEQAVKTVQTSKFPTPEELIASEAGKTEKSDQIEAAPRFDSDHAQGNYDFTRSVEADETYSREIRDFEIENSFPADGEGYLKLEVTCEGQPLESALAAVSRMTDSGDVLVSTFTTGSDGETEAITLPVLGIDEKYAVTVAKEGYFTVHNLEIPIFDSIKSIQPVELKKEQQ